ncbi:MAG TPA: 23S rRNA (pseudouridine(1915)-N(3))-methyltransferase RlmH [Lachnospiraceae bacterium]|nr:23S rRNA (pseudouridine(1915)-N(3))-methyltransferase RlmH [Lachnospiraceae bacterium]HBR05229.1 23S rRNA (pseudouridine(1915)-N(3))-methyltransferase RlmH [Lachnospiraceae bacterium]
MKITVICVGKSNEKFYTDAVKEYAKRLSRYCKLDIIEVADEKTVENASENVDLMIKRKEGDRILKNVPDDSYVIAMAIEGKMMTSVELSEKINDLAISARSSITFIIGGSLGLAPEVMARADYKLSFSKMTFPHMLFRVMLLEQIYRSFRIINHEPYHK